jgi:hypothetical protein
MATMTPLALPSPCSEKRELWSALVTAFQGIIDLQTRQITAVMTGQSEDTRFDLLLQSARIRRDAAKSQYLEHVAEHGC